MKYKMNTRSKYGAKKTHRYGKKFDSMLELFFYERLLALGITFEFQKKITLQPKFRFQDKGIREIYMLVDFVIDVNGTKVYIDTKGFFTDVAKLKYKMLTYKKHEEGENFMVIFVKNKSKATDLALEISEWMRDEN